MWIVDGKVNVTSGVHYPQLQKVGYAYRRTLHKLLLCVTYVDVLEP